MNEFAKTPFSNHKKGSPMHLLSTSIMSCGRLQQHVASPVTQMNSHTCYMILSPVWSGLVATLLLLSAAEELMPPDGMTSTEQSSHYEPFLARVIITSNQPIASADLPAISDASDDGYEASFGPSSS